LTAPAEAVVEEICGNWAKQLLGIPASASFAFVTGCQMAHTTAIAAARYKLLRDRQWNVEEMGLAGGPPLRILTTESRHDSIIRTVRLLGIGTKAITYVPSDPTGRMDCAALSRALDAAANTPTIVILQAGDLNTGLFDSFEQAIQVAHEHGAWVHMDGAFGLWAATSPKYRHLLKGSGAADSWATDGHKWLNLPFDSGLVFVADPAAHRAALLRAQAILCRWKKCETKRIGTRNGRAVAGASRLMPQSARSDVLALPTSSNGAAHTPLDWSQKSEACRASKYWCSQSSIKVLCVFALLMAITTATQTT
jgi:glutamate/tyrosine decarboxylase-like PLP-dependent enzyme